MASTFPPQPVNTIGKTTLVHMQPYLPYADCPADWDDIGFKVREGTSAIV